MTSSAASSAALSGTNGMSVGMPTSSTSSSGTSGSTGSRGSFSQMAGSQFSPMTARERKLREIQQVERLRQQLEEDLKKATNREKEIKSRATRLDTLEANKAALQGLDESSVSDPLKVSRDNMLSLHAHVDSRMDFMQSTLDQILDALTKPGFRPPAQSPLPLTAMSSPFAVQAGTQPSGTSAAATQTVASSSSGPVVIATSPQQPVQQSGQQQGQWYPKTPMKPPLAFSGERKDEELNTWLRTVPVWVKAKMTLPEDEVVTAASYLEGKAAKWLDGVVVKAGYGRHMADWAKSLTLDQFMEMVEARWHNPQEAQRATDAINKLDQRKFSDSAGQSQGGPLAMAVVADAGWLECQLPDMKYKMKKKIAQLTKVIHHLNNKAEEQDFELQDVAGQYESEIEHILKEAADKMSILRDAIETQKEEKKMSEMMQVLIEKHELEKKQAMEELASYKKVG
ncbi:hypothetical protein CBR_g19637 [Chara braunii]|uniref:Uncharacterized protein n=1 Tax=Chara braunii TaxID=69332 RepID=A0A388KYI7_CHABU|nr:hypothetical protein CBR_g19637 [Chara braunii]|eukprot:GBG75124.1 hypothetical protein CBR_g19637 [Chara braunii]